MSISRSLGVGPFIAIVLEIVVDAPAPHYIDKREGHLHVNNTTGREIFMRGIGRLLMVLSFVLVSCQGVTASEVIFTKEDIVHQVSTSQDGVSKTKSRVGRYIVKLIEPPLATYKGGIKNLQSTSPETGGQRLNMESAAAIQYHTHLEARQQTIQVAIEGNLGRSLQTLQSYQVAYNGFAAEMSAQEAARVANLAGVAAVLPDTIQYLQSDNGPGWIGADDIWDGTSGVVTQGEGIVIGVIDTGINPANRSFADVGDDGYDHDNPKGAGVHFGFCDPGSAQYDASFSCNDKLIGAYDFVYTGTELYDNDGHGSHTASTAGGNVILSATVNAPTTSFSRDISGVAPHSNIISYKSCGANGCQSSSLLAAIDQAVTDGVDVINYSIGGGATNPWTSPTAEAFLNARNVGVFVATSAGNSGPGSETVGSPANAPWLLSVGSSSHNRQLTTALINFSRTDAVVLSDISGKSVSGALPPNSIVYAGDDPYNNALCGDSVWAAGTFSGQIVVCDRGTYGRVVKGQNVLDAGGGGYILANDITNGNSLMSDTHVLPAVHISYNDGVALKNWLASSASHQGEITATSIDVADVNGDIISSFSSRGANSLVPGVLKPDVSAPGQDILAAYGTNNEQIWGVISGTSMASPHAAGAAALLLSQHPTWSPAIVQSALMTSADTTVLKEDGVTNSDPFDTGSGRIDVSRATRTGLAFEATYADFIAANPSTGGDPSALNLPSLAATVNVALGNGSWTRTVKSTFATGVTWTAAVTNPAGVVLSVSPPSFTLASGETQEVTISAVSSGAAVDSWLFGAIVFSPDTGQTVSATLPVAIKQVVVPPPPEQIRYKVTTSLTDPTCDTGFGGYVDLEAFGIAPAPGVSGDTMAWIAFAGQNPIDFFGSTYSDGITFTDDGFAILAGTIGASPWSPVNLPNAAEPNTLMAALWHDFEIVYNGTPGAIRGVSVATAGADVSIIEYDDVQLAGTTDIIGDFEIIVNTAEGAKDIVFAYNNLNQSLLARSFTVGIENEAGNNAHALINNAAATGILTDGLMICFEVVLPFQWPMFLPAINANANAQP